MDEGNGEIVNNLLKVIPGDILSQLKHLSHNDFEHVLRSVRDDLNNKPRLSDLENDNKFTCSICNQKFQRKWNFNRHINAHLNNDEKFQCEHCPSSYKREDNLQQHLKKKHGVIYKRKRTTKSQVTLNLYLNIQCNDLSH